MKPKRPIILVDETPISLATFESQGWTKNDESSEENGDIVYWTLPLPKNNPDGDTICFISSDQDEWDILGIPEGTYIVNLFGYNDLGVCSTEEEVEILYRYLTGEDIYDGTEFEP